MIARPAARTARRESRVSRKKNRTSFPISKRLSASYPAKAAWAKALQPRCLPSLCSGAGFKTALLDADITGPSAPKLFGLTKKAQSDGSGIYPVETKSGIKVMSLNLLLENDSDPVVWRGPVIAGAVKQFWTDVIWNDVDYMFVDMPPGTGDVPLTVFQSLPVDGIIVVTSPQELVSMIVTKAVKMAQLMNVPIVGVIENYSYLVCPDCKKRINVFGDSHIGEITDNLGIDLLAKIPIDPELASSATRGLSSCLRANGWRTHAIKSKSCNILLSVIV